MSEDQDSTSTNEDMSEDPDTGIITLNEVLEYQDQLIEDSAAVLGALNDKNCSYAEGYIKRQALYSCLTCVPESKLDLDKAVGVCLACSYHCHDGHELVELYTKRNFRCDCGNSKLPGIKCNLLEEKEDLNELNAYNHNFQGSYCVCHRPYPDPDDPTPDEMIQCIICEDWYHSRHLAVPLPSAFVEMVCLNCIKDHEFLLHYDGSVATVEDESTTEKSVDLSDIIPIEDSKSENGEESKDDEENLEKCKKPKTKSEIVGTKFWPDISWRKQLCQCEDCLSLYDTENVLFLIDPEDPVCLYEEKGKAKTKQFIEDEDRKMLGSLDRVQLVETIAGYNELKNGLAEFLKTFAENEKVVREEDVKEFFEVMQAKKKQKTEMQYFCR